MTVREGLKALGLFFLFPGIVFWIMFSWTLIWMGDLQEYKKARIEARERA